MKETNSGKGCRGAGGIPFGVNLRGAGSSLPGFQGCPLMVLFFARRLRRRAKREKEVFRGHPEPWQRAGRPLQSHRKIVKLTPKGVSPNKHFFNGFDMTRYSGERKDCAIWYN